MTLYSRQTDPLAFDLTDIVCTPTRVETAIRLQLNDIFANERLRASDERRRDGNATVRLLSHLHLRQRRPARRFLGPTSPGDRTGFSAAEDFGRLLLENFHGLLGRLDRQSRTGR